MRINYSTLYYLSIPWIRLWHYYPILASGFLFRFSFYLSSHWNLGLVSTLDLHSTRHGLWETSNTTNTEKIVKRQIYTEKLSSLTGSLDVKYRKIRKKSKPFFTWSHSPFWPASIYHVTARALLRLDSGLSFRSMFRYTNLRAPVLPLNIQWHVMNGATNPRGILEKIKKTSETRIMSQKKTHITSKARKKIKQPLRTSKKTK